MAWLVRDGEVDLIAFGEDGDGAVGSWLQLHTRPFYRRPPAT